MGRKTKKVASLALNKAAAVGKRREDDERDEKEKFSKYFRESGIPRPDRWPERSPIYVAASKRAGDVTYQLPQNANGGGGGGAGGVPAHLPLDGQPVDFEGPSFRGKIVSRMRDVPPGAAADGGGASGDRITR